MTIAMGSGADTDDPIVGGGLKNPIVSFCIPVKNRFEDVEQTLGANLDDNRIFRDSVEFLVVCFDDDDHLSIYLNEEFGEDIGSGYLRIERVSGLDRWHFGRAKNAFKPFLRGRLYSSLDADNFVSADETQLLLHLFRRFGQRMIVHHFSGMWGDGTCGRVTMGTDLYRQVGYDPTFLPRQFDEIDFIVSAMKASPGIPYITYVPGGAIGMSQITTDYLTKIKVPVNNILADHLKRRAPLNPKDTNYANDDDLLVLMERFNRETCFAKNSVTATDRAQHAAEVTKAGFAIIELADPKTAVDTFLLQITNTFIEIDASSVPVFACVKDDEWLLREWIGHYRSIGAGPFFLIDDGSAIPVSRTLDEPDVHVFSPRCGQFRTSKVVWIKALMKRFLADGQWAITADADEFIDFPIGSSSLSERADALDTRRQGIIPGILVDMLPGHEGVQTIASGQEVLQRFDRYLDADVENESEYAASPPIKWAWGPNWRRSYVIDARYHLFGTIDILRKIPMVKYRSDLLLNQGFHDASFGASRLTPALWSGALLPIRHYKLAKLFSDAERNRLSAHANRCNVYHERTTENLGRIVSADVENFLSRLRKIETALYDPAIFATSRASLPWRLMSPFWDLYRPVRRLYVSRFGVRLRAVWRHPGNSKKRKAFRANRMGEYAVEHEKLPNS